MKVRAILNYRKKSVKEISLYKPVANSRTIELAKPAKIYKYLSTREAKDIREFANQHEGKDWKKKEASYRLVDGKIVKI